MPTDVLSQIGANDPNLSAQMVALRLGAATLLSMVLGWEREMRRRPAGLRTHMMVGLGAAAFYLITIELALGDLRALNNISVDPTRVFEGVITGIGFLGAGAIIQRGGNVVGLTTGAGIWVAGGVGLACGGGYFIVAGLVTAFALIILSVMYLVERRVIHDRRSEASDSTSAGDDRPR